MWYFLDSKLRSFYKANLKTKKNTFYLKASSYHPTSPLFLSDMMQ